jgi:hypothetical protein
MKAVIHSTQLSLPFRTKVFHTTKKEGPNMAAAKTTTKKKTAKKKAKKKGKK